MAAYLTAVRSDYTLQCTEVIRQLTHNNKTLVKIPGKIRQEHTVTNLVHVNYFEFAARQRARGRGGIGCACIYVCKCLQESPGSM